jgi:hypothetical protein
MDRARDGVALLTETAVLLAALSTVLPSGAPLPSIPPLSAPPPQGGQIQGQDGKEDVFEKVDPYTHGDEKALERAGYVGYGPFAWADGVTSKDVQEAMGGGDVLWLETPHFRIGSTLSSYRFHNDVREQKALEAELARLKSRLVWWQPPRVKLDPWMRLHLYAMRFEDVYADFAGWFGYATDEAARKKGAAAPKKPGDSLGREPPQKIRVLLAGKSSALARYVKHFADREPAGHDRFVLPGGAQFLGVNEEGLYLSGYELDIAVHCVAAGALVHSLIDAHTGTVGTTPLWLEYGLDHVVTRGIDERYPSAAVNTVRLEDEASFRWEVRVKGLVVNGAAPSWAETAAWKDWSEIKTSGHLVSWSRVAWLLKRKPAELRAFLEGVAGPEAESGESRRTPLEAQSKAAKAAFGKTLEELDALWRKQASR